MDKDTIAKVARKIYVNMQIEEILPLEKYEIFVKPDFDSASWRFHNGKHQIVIGAYIFNNLTVDIPFKDKALYVRAYLYHELAHSIWTDKNLNAINAKLKTLNFSFSMFNLFEDARIEEKMRHHVKKRFNWLKYETMRSSENPIDIFFYLIQSEHNKKAIEFIKANLELSVEHHFDTVELFYKKAVECESHEDVIALLKKWYDRFPNTPKYEQENVLKSFIYNVESKYGEDDSKFDELIEGLDNLLVGVTSSQEDTQEKVPKKTLRGRLRKRTERESLLAHIPLEVAFDEKTRDLLLRKMKKLFLSPARMSSTTLPSKRLSVKNIVAKNHKIFKRKDKVSFVKKRITIILDLSGSMWSTIANMRLIIDVLDKMCSKNLLDATLILSGVSNGNNLCEKYSFPLREGLLERIVPDFDAEGLHNAMSANLTSLRKSDYVWVFTDGMICEGPLSKEFYHGYGIKTHAFYIGDSNYTKELEKSFDCVVCEKDVINLTNQIFTLVK